VEPTNGRSQIVNRALTELRGIELATKLMATIAIALLAYLFFMIETVQLFQSCDYFFSIKLSHL
jgi:hypothetical protein